MTGSALINIMGQSINNDPTYSINNYKHPNKAKEAKETGKNNMICFKVSHSQTGGNYKQQNNNIRAFRGNRKSDTNKLTQYNSLTNPGNYKTHH